MAEGNDFKSEDIDMDGNGVDEGVEAASLVAERLRATTFHL